MKVLIFALLAVAASAHSYYSSYPSYGSYYPSTYGSSGIGYGLGYGGSYGGGYGGGYGSGVSYVLGGAGHSYGGSLGGQYATSYARPAVYQTARHSYQYPHGTGAAYISRVPAVTAIEEPAKISYIQDISGIAGQSGYQTGTPVEFNFDALQGPAAPKSSGIYTKEVKTVHGTGAHGGAAAVKTITRDFSQKDGQSELHIIPEAVGVSGIKQPFTPVTTVVERPSSVSSHGVRFAQKSGVQDSKTTGGQPQISITRDFSKVTDGHSGIKAVQPEIVRVDKVAVAPKPVSGSNQGTRVVQKTRSHVSRTNEQPQVSFVQDFSKVQRQSGFAVSKPEIHRTPSGFHGGSGSVHGSRTQGVKSTGVQGQIVLTREITKTTGQSQKLGIRPEIFTRGKIHAPVVTSHDIQGFGVGSLGNADVRDQGEIVYGDVSGQFGHQFAGVKPAYTDGIFRQTIHHLGGVRPAYITDISRHSSYHPAEIRPAYFTGISRQPGYHPAGIRPAVAAFDKFSTGRVTTLPKPYPGYAQRAGAFHKTRPQTFSGVGGPQISFTLGGAAFHQPGSRFVSYDQISAPRVAAAPKLPTGHSRVIGGVQKSTVGGFPTAAVSQPGHISFTRDYSKVSGHQISGVRPGIAGVDKVRISAFPETTVSRQPVQRYPASFAPKPVQKPFVEKRVFKTPAQPIVQQPTLTAIHDLTPIQGSISGSTNVEGDKATFIAGPEIGVVDSKSAHFKHNIASTQGQIVNKFINVPVDSFDDQKSAIAFHSTGVAPAGNIAEEKGSILQLSHGGPNSAVTSGRFGQTYRYTSAFRSSPFRTYYSSAYPGYSQVSGESPRFGFSPDRSLLYSYSSPHLVSPFSYSYTTGSKEYVQKPIS